MSALQTFQEKKSNVIGMEWELSAGAHLQVGNTLSTGAVQDMGTLEKSKIHINGLLSWNSYSLLESSVILLELL